MLPITFHELISSFCEFIATEGTFVQLIKRYYAAHFLESPISNFFAILNNAFNNDELLNLLL